MSDIYFDHQHFALILHNTCGKCGDHEAERQMPSDAMSEARLERLGTRVGQVRVELLLRVRARGALIGRLVVRGAVREALQLLVVGCLVHETEAHQLHRHQRHAHAHHRERAVAGDHVHRATARSQQTETSAHNKLRRGNRELKYRHYRTYSYV